MIITYLQYYAIKCKQSVKTIAAILLISKQLTYAQSTDMRANKPKAAAIDSLKADTTAKPSTDTINYKIAATDLQDIVTYQAKDSIIYDAESKTFYLYNNSKIKYTDLELNADEVTFNTDSSLLVAYSTKIGVDTAELPLFKQGDQTFTFDSLQYKFTTQRALVLEAATKYGEGYINSTQIKRNKDQSIYGIDNVYSTCELDHPHFGIHAKKIKVIPNVVGISGPARLFIEELPTPIILPFAIYPLAQGQRAGFILPQYGFEPNRGFGLRGGGYYFPISEYMDLKLNGDIFTYGSWRFGAGSAYIRKYKYSGNLNVSISNNRLESEQFRNNSANRTFSVDWSHTVDPKRLRNATFNASVRVASSNNNQLNFNQNIQNFLENRYTSSITYQKSWPGKPYNFTATLGHTQDNNSGLFEIRLPEATFSASGLTPFARKTIIGKQRWYEKINFNYTGRAINKIDFYDTAFNIARVKMGDFRNGISHTLSTSYNRTILRYFNFGVNANYDEYWYSRKDKRAYDAAIKRVDTVTDFGFFTARRYSAGASLTTTIYGTKLFKKGKVRGLRHTVIPELGFSYNPDFGKAPFTSYYETYLDTSSKVYNLSYFEQSIIGRPNAGKNGSITFNIRNALQAKVLNKRDTVNSFNKISLLDNLNIRTSYNLAADSFRLSPLAMNYSTNLLNGKLNINGGAAWDFYGWDYVNRRRSKTLAWYKNAKPLRFENFSINISSSLRSLNGGNASKLTDEQKRLLSFNEYNYYDFSIPWDVNFNAQLSLNRGFTRDGLRDSLKITPTTTIGGNITLTENWKVGTQTSYDFQNKSVGATQFNISRDLHCWQMNITLIPFGSARSYFFTLQPKSGMLQDLKVTRRREFWNFQ